MGIWGWGRDDEGHDSHHGGDRMDDIEGFTDMHAPCACEWGDCEQNGCFKERIRVLAQKVEWIQANDDGTYNVHRRSVDELRGER